VQARALRAIDRIAAAHGNGDDVLIVAHGGVISALLAHWLGLPLSSIWRLAVANCSLTEIAPPRVVSMNETGHLREVNVVVTEPLSP
jgi:broad specificity phosphatase PhoE